MTTDTVVQKAPGSLSRIEVTLPHISRVKDYLSNEGFKHLMKFNREDPATVKNSFGLTDSILNSELDFTNHLHLYDNKDQKVGLVSYTCNHTTFSPRVTAYDPDMLDAANDKNGGRMSQVYFDIHQGSVQNWLLTKNDVVFENNIVETTQRLHPHLGPSYNKVSYVDAYENQTVTPKDLFVSFVKKTAGLTVEKEHDEHLQLLDSQQLTHRIFSSTYERIAREYAHPGVHEKIVINLG